MISRYLVVMRRICLWALITFAFLVGAMGQTTRLSSGTFNNWRIVNNPSILLEDGSKVLLEDGGTMKAE